MSDARKKAFEEIHDKIYSMRRVMTPEKPHMYALGALVAYGDMAEWLYSEMLEMDEDSLLLRPGSAELRRREDRAQARAEGRREGIEEAAREADRFAYNWAHPPQSNWTPTRVATAVAIAIRALATPAGKEG